MRETSHELRVHLATHETHETRETHARHEPRILHGRFHWLLKDRSRNRKEME